MKSPGLVCSVLLAAAPPCLAQGRVKRFDMGSATSPVAAGFTRVDPSLKYSSTLGYGWTTSGHRAYVRPAEVAVVRHTLPFSLIQDGVADTADCTFRIDLSAGTYLCIAYLGDIGTETLRTPRTNLDVLANKVEVISNAHARTAGSKARFDLNAFGGYKRVRFLAQPIGGKLELTFHCDGTGTSINSIMGLEIYPYLPEPIRFDHASGKLVAAPAYRAMLATALAAFNRHDYGAARKAFDAVSDPLARAWGYAWLLGWLRGEESDFDVGLLQSAKTLLAGLNKPDDPRVAVLLQDLKDFELGNLYNQLRGYSRETFPDSLGNIVYNLSAAVALFEQLDDDILLAAPRPASPECPLYPMARFLIARNMYSRYTGVGDPRGAWAATWLSIFKNEFAPKRAALFPKAANLEVFTFFATRYALNGGLVKNWRGPTSVPSFDPAKTWWAPLVEIPDHPAAPKWANMQRAYLKQFRNAGTWWMARRLYDGEIGGGGGDDVEGAGLLSLPAIAESEPGHPLELGIRACMEKVLYGPEIDQREGYFSGCADVEHTAEYTSYPLFALLPTDFGNPRHVEMALKVIHNMDEKADRLPWTRLIVSGRRHFKSYKFGATAICGPARDCPLTMRAAIPGFFLVDYNNQPRTKQLFDELARAWAADAMSTAQNKPKGILPCSVSATNPPVFGTAGKWWLNGGYVDLPYGTAYYGYLYALMLSAYQNSTAADRYKLLEPFVAGGLLCYANLKGQLTGTQPGGDKWATDALMTVIANALAEAYPAIASEKNLNLSAADLAKLSYVISQRASPYLQYLHQSGTATKSKLALERVFERARTWMRYFWVLGTTSVSYTDRIYVFNSGSHQLLYSTLMGGAFSVNPSYVISWVDPEPTKGPLDMAALVHGFGVDSLDILLFNFAPRKRDFAFRLWRRLKFGKYRVSIGNDANHDDKMDGTPHTVFYVDYNARGMTIRLPQVPSGVLQKIELRLVSPLPGAGAYLPDLAVGARDVALLTGGKLQVTVHNIGSADVIAGTLTVLEGTRTIGTAAIGTLQAPNDLRPHAKTFVLPYAPSKPGAPVTVRLKLTSPASELTLFNNEVTTVPALYCPAPANYGPGLRGARGVPVLQSSGGLPRIGNRTFGLRLSRTYASAPLIYALGGNKAYTRFFGGVLLVRPALLLTAFADRYGSHFLPLPIPNDKNLIGLPLYGQVFIVDRTAPRRFAMTPGLETKFCGR